MQKPDLLTTSGRFNFNYHIYFSNKHLISVRDGQFAPATGGHSHYFISVRPFYLKKSITCFNLCSIRTYKRSKKTVVQL